MSNSEVCPEIEGYATGIMPEISQGDIQIQHPSILPLQCSECDLVCPSIPALELHSKLHILERICQNSNESQVESIMQTLVSRENKDDPSYNNSEPDYSSERPHKCDTCGYRFTNASHLKRHMRIHTGDKPYACSLCDYRCARTDKLKIHMQSHNTGENFETRLVDSTDNESRTKILISHNTKDKEENAFINPGERPHKCDVCGFRFTIAAHLKRHMSTHTGEKPYACSECNYRSARSDKLKKHMKSHYRGTRGLSVPLFEQKDIKPLIDSQASQEVKEETVFSNSVSSEELPQRGRPKMHLNGKCYSCTLCDYTCSKRYQLTRHMFLHKGSKPHTCPFCDYECIEKGNLKQHMVIHSNDKPFSCPVEGCKHKCKLRSNLRTHMLRMHSTDKPWACHICDYRCNTKAELTNHMFKHSGEKPFKCTECDKQYALEGDLTVHMRSHTGDLRYECLECDYKCLTKSNLNQHMLTHTGEKNHECAECHSRFTTSRHLEMHIQLQHVGKAKIANIFTNGENYIVEKEIDNESDIPNIGETQ